MKSKYVILASALLISVSTFAQKDQIKAAEKAFKAGNSQEAVTILKDAETVMVNATEAEKAQFSFVKGNALLDLAIKEADGAKYLTPASKAYQEVIEIEKATGKLKYSTQAAASIVELKGRLINAAIADTKADKNKEGAQKLYDAYLLDKNDTINLYYAAATYVAAKDYDSALKGYEELIALKYSGKGTNYFAVNKVSNEEERFSTVKDRDDAVKLKSHENPRTEEIPSKRGEITKTVAQIYIEMGKTNEAKKAISDARKANPDDDSLILAEANLYLETKDYDSYKKLIAEALAKNPNDTNLIFNLGVISANANDPIAAQKYYDKAIGIDPKYTAAYLNSAALKLEKVKKIEAEMNKLGNTEKEIKRYNALNIEKKQALKDTLPYLEKAYLLDPANEAVSSSLLSVYRALEMNDKAKELKAKM